MVRCEICGDGDRTNGAIMQIQYAAIGERIRSRRLEMGLTRHSWGVWPASQAPSWVAWNGPRRSPPWRR